MKRIIAILIFFSTLVSCAPTSAAIRTSTSTAQSLPTASTTPVPSKQILRFSAAQNICWNLGNVNPNVSQIEVMKCAQDDLDQQKAKLANLISEIKSSFATKQQSRAILGTSWALPADTLSKLDEVQQDWEKVASEHCYWEAKFHAGSSSAPMAYISCMATRTSERIQQLKIFLCDGEGFNGSCPAADKY